MFQLHRVKLVGRDSKRLDWRRLLRSSQWSTRMDYPLMLLILTSSSSNRCAWFQMQGGLFVSAAIQLGISLTGFPGLVLKYAGPITVACTIISAAAEQLSRFTRELAHDRFFYPETCLCNFLTSLFRLAQTDFISATFVVIILFFCLTFKDCACTRKPDACCRSPALFMSKFLRVFSVFEHFFLLLNLVRM